MKRTDGFTMIEMMLAMVFVAFLMLAIALTTIYIGNTYTKGVTMSQVDEAGRTISTDMQRTITSAPPQTAIKKGAHGLTAVCFGNYTYIWNPGRNIRQNPSGGNWPSNVILYNQPGTELHSQPVHLAKVLDPDASYCSDAPHSGRWLVDDAGAVELLPSGDRNLAIQKLNVDLLTTTATQTLYSVSFVLGTNNQDALTGTIESNNLSCRPPSDIDNDITYCAVNNFDFLVRAGGGK